MKYLTEKDNLLKSLERVITFSHSQGFSGFDPYDALNSPFINKMDSSRLKLALSQFLVYSPINFRNLLSIKKGLNPKGVALFIRALCLLSKFKGSNEHENKIRSLSNWLIKNRTSGYSGACWGYNFPWQSALSHKSKGLPTIVTTSFVANALLDAYEFTKNEKYFSIAESSCNFILNDLPLTENKSGICFSYSPQSQDVVHNANALGAALLSRVYSYNKDIILKSKSTLSIDFLLSEQKKEGYWAYMYLNSKSGYEKNQIDWHQGFIIDSINDYLQYTKSSEKKYSEKIIIASKFYKDNQFLETGQSLWRYPMVWPVDIHNQAQGIITFSRVSYFDKNYLNFAHKIAEWTISKMQDPSGFFYFQKWPLLTNKISYMRWSQAWMSLALATIIDNLEVKGSY